MIIECLTKCYNNRGIILAVILNELEKRTGRKLSEMFHLVCGTSTGALSARCIQYGLNGEEIMSLYSTLANIIFSSKQPLGEAVTKFYKVVSSGVWYDGAKLESLVMNLIGRSRNGNQILTLNDLHNVSPKAFFVSTLVPEKKKDSTSNDEDIADTVSTDESISYIFRTYPCPFTKDQQPTRYLGTWNGQNVTVASSLRASTAAPGKLYMI